MRYGRFKKAVSGFLAAMTIMTTVFSPLSAYAAEVPPEEPKPPLYEEVKDQLDADEVVKAEDLELEYGCNFDVKTDFSNIEIPDNEKVKVTFEEAKNESGEEFTTQKSDSYKAVYYVQPLKTEHPKYQISRKLIVKEAPQTEQETETPIEAAEDGNSSESGEEQSDDGLVDIQMPEEAQPVVIEQETPSDEEVSTEEETAEVTEAPAESATEEITEAPEESEPEKTTEIPMEEATKDFSEGLSEEEFDEALEEAENQETYDQETGLDLEIVLTAARDQDIDLFALEEGESVEFYVEAPSLIVTYAASTTKKVTITRGSWYYYADYGLGSYQTAPYKVKYGSVSATAYCVQPSKRGPDDGTYKITKLSDGKSLAKVCYYGTKASGDDGFFAEKHPDFSAGKRFIITHMAAAYANGSSDAFSGTNSTGKSLAMELYNYCMSQPEIPEVDMAFSNPNVTAYVDGKQQRTEEVTFLADTLQSITFKLPSGVKFHNVTTGKTSAAGASVEINGGTKFYLSAPITQAADVSATFSATMKGTIVKDYSAYKISTGGDLQDLAFVFGEAVDDEKYVDFSATWVSQASVSIVKKDKKTNAAVAGAVYGLYSDPDCTNLIMEMPATDANGASSVTLNKTQDMIYLKEISGPTGYLLDTAVHNIQLVVGKTSNQVVTDEEQKANLTVYKEGEVLTGANVTAEGVSFVYEKRRQKGAVYNVYAALDIKRADGTVVYKQGALVKENLTTGDDGSATLKELYLGTYRVTEMKAPTNLICAGESKEVTLSYAGQNVEVAVGDLTFVNDRQKAKVFAEKQDKDTKKPLAGAVFGLYAGKDIKNQDGQVVVVKDTLIAKATTDEMGSGAFAADLPNNNSYYVKELQAPVNYFRNSDEVYSFDFQYTNDKEATVSFSHTFSNEHVSASIHLVKKDKETGNVTQGDAKFAGAVYGVYARENIAHPDGKSGVLYKKDAQVATMTVDDSGNARVENLFLGKYYVKEITPPTGYLLDEEEHDVDCNYEGDQVKNIERTAESSETVVKQPFEVIKVANNGKTDADLLKGAGFTAYLASSLKVKEDGSYDFTGAKPVVITEDGKTEMFTDAKGYAKSIPLPYGKYVVRETTTPHNYKPVDDFVVTISENHPNEPQRWRVLLDDEFHAKLKIIKKDDETKKSVLVAGTEFKIFDLNQQKYVEQVTTYPTVQKHTSFFTDSDGYLILPESLKIGNYRIEEVTAPDGYTLSKNYVEVNVDSNTAYLQDATTGDAIIEVEYENHPVKGELSIYKKGEVLAGYDGKDFQYEEKYLSGAEFEVYAAENVYTADYQKDADGNRILEYAEGELVTTVTTDDSGLAVVKNLPLGSYLVKEANAPTGFVLNAVPQEVSFDYADQNTAIIKESVTFDDDRQKVEITVEKQDAENEATIAGAVFGIYNTEDLKNEKGEIIVKADTLLQERTSDEDGSAVFTVDLPLGQYYVKELKAPAGFVSSDEILTFDASYQGQDIAVVKLKEVKKNQPTTVEITKSDITTGTELEGASLKILDKDGNVVDEWTSVKDQPHVIKRLVVGEEYTLREEIAPYGYLKATDIKFTLEDTAEVQKVEMKDEVPTALLIINKKGEFLDKVTLLDNAKGTVEHLFEYISGNLTEVTFEVYAAEDIKAADGISEDYYKADDLVGTITTDDTGIAQLGDLPVGKYYVKEVATAHGYVLDDEIRYVDLSYRDQDTPVVTYDEDWQNARQKVTVQVLKKEKDSDRVLKGAIFGLFTAEDIKSVSGNVLLEADEIIEQKTTDENGRITFLADLPVDGKYYVKELQAPDGFVTTEEEQEFTFEYEGEDVTDVTYEFTFENEPTTVELTKSDLTTGEELPGAHLKVTDEAGNTVDEWTSTKEAHAIKELVVGKKYKLTETKPADGFVTAESIEFTIENTAEIQKHEMKDDVTKVQISKTDITGDQEIPGAKLTILDENDQVVESWTSSDKPHYVEKLPIGKYTLREEQAPKGFILTNDVTFEVADTEEIQTVLMKDDTAKGKVIINKTDADTEKPLKGVEYELRDSNGKVLEKLVTDAAGHAESGLYEIATYKNGKFSEAIKYYLVETKTLDGYELDQTEHEIVFEYADQNTPIIEVKKDLTNKETQPGTPGTPTSGNPKTGDETNLWLPVVLMLSAAAVMAGVLVSGKRKKKQNKSEKGND